jgi:cytosine deaminase
MLDLIIRNARIVGHTDKLQDIAVKGGKIADVGSSLQAEAAQEYDAAGYLVTAPFIDSHFHMDATLS